MSLNGSKPRQNRSQRVVGGQKNLMRERQLIAQVVRKAERRARELKFFDTSQSAQSIGAGAALNVLTGVTQGVGQSQRVADMLEYDHVNFTYSIQQANADIYSDVRVIIFQWHPNTTLTGSPVLANILPNTAAIGLYSATNWQYRDQFTILYDKLWSLSGLATAPTSTTTVNGHNIRLNNMRKKVTFSPGAITGDNLLWLLTISDSSIAPFPLFNIQFRTVYCDE